MKLVTHIAVFAGFLLSMLLSTQPLLCLALGLVVPVVIFPLSLRVKSGSVGSSLRNHQSSARSGAKLFLGLALGMFALAAYMAVTYFPLSEALARRALIAGGMYYVLGMIVGLGGVFAFLGWQARRGVSP